MYVRRRPINWNFILERTFSFKIFIFYWSHDKPIINIWLTSTVGWFPSDIKGTTGISCKPSKLVIPCSWMECDILGANRLYWSSLVQFIFTKRLNARLKLNKFVLSLFYSHENITTPILVMNRNLFLNKRIEEYDIKL